MVQVPSLERGPIIMKTINVIGMRVDCESGHHIVNLDENKADDIIKCEYCKKPFVYMDTVPKKTSV